MNFASKARSHKSKIKVAQVVSIHVFDHHSHAKQGANGGGGAKN